MSLLFSGALTTSRVLIARPSGLVVVLLSDGRAGAVALGSVASSMVMGSGRDGGPFGDVTGLKILATNVGLTADALIETPSRSD